MKCLDTAEMSKLWPPFVFLGAFLPFIKKMKHMKKSAHFKKPIEVLMKVAASFQVFRAAFCTAI